MVKPNRLPLTENVLACTAIFHSIATQEQDATLDLLIRYQAIIQLVHETYQVALPSRHFHSQRLLALLDAWSSSVPKHIRDLGLFASRYEFGKIWIHEMGMLYHYRTNGPPVDIGASDTTQSGFYANLVHCVDAIKSYLDQFLRIDASDYDALPFEEWSRLVMACFILYKLSAGPREFSGWDVQLCRSRIDLELYFDVVAGRLRQASLYDSVLDISSAGLLHALPEILDSAKYTFTTTKNTPSSCGLDIRVHVDLTKTGPVKASMEAIAGKADSLTSPGRLNTRRKCPATALWTRNAMVNGSVSGWHEVSVNNHNDPSAQLEAGRALWDSLLGAS